MRQAELVWVDRTGEITGIMPVPASGSLVDLSPDGSTVALTIREGRGIRLELLDLERVVATPVARVQSMLYSAPLWFPDGASLALSSSHPLGGEIRRYQTIEPGAGELFLEATSSWGVAPAAISNDAKYLAVATYGRDTSGDVTMCPLQGGSPIPFLDSAENEWLGDFSPDGNWYAYTSQELAQDEVFIRRFPDGGEKTRISEGGGGGPLWSQDGTELFYQLPGSGGLVAVPVSLEPVLKVGSPSVLFDGSFAVSGNLGKGWDVAPGGERFLMIRLHPDYGVAREIVILQNWIQRIEELTSSGPS